MGFRSDLLICTTLECESKEEMLAAIDKAKEEGANLVELCIDSMSFSHISEVEDLLRLRTLPSIVSFRSNLRRGRGCSSKKTGLQVLRLAVELDVEFVEIEFEMATEEVITELMCRRSNTKIIISSYLKNGGGGGGGGGTLCKEKLGNLVICLQSTGADVIKLVVDVAYITDVAPLFHLLAHSQVPLIARAVGDRGLISQLLGPKFGAHVVWGSLGDKPVPGLPPLLSITQVYKLEHVNPDTKVFGVISNPVGHSKGPLLHNPAFRHTRYNGTYVPLLVDNIKEFFRVYSCSDFAGFSVGIPHKEAAVGCCDEVDPLAKVFPAFMPFSSTGYIVQAGDSLFGRDKLEKVSDVLISVLNLGLNESIGAVNTIIRRPTDGKLIGYNTDCDACITAIEEALRERRITNGHASHTSPIAGKLFVLVGAGGAGRAMAFGAKSRGARVVIFNRNFERAKALASAVSGEALPYECLGTYCAEKGMILANASAVGMQPNKDQTPVPKEALGSYELVFDAVYTPRNTRLLQEAAEVGAIVISGVEMFIRQALGQFKLFTGGLAPEDFMRQTVLEKF